MHKPIPSDDGLRQKLLSNIKVSDGCWIWQGEIVPGGYGRVQWGGRNIRYVTHRVAYEHFVGSIPDGLVLDHLCRVRACCNPDHLEPVTNRENLLRGIGFPGQQARQTLCKRGLHPLRYRGDGKRYCPPCSNEAQRQRKTSAA